MLTESPPKIGPIIPPKLPIPEATPIPVDLISEG